MKNNIHLTLPFLLSGKFVDRHIAVRTHRCRKLCIMQSPKRTTCILGEIYSCRELTKLLQLLDFTSCKARLFYRDVFFSMASRCCSDQSCYLTAQVAGSIPISVWILHRSFGFCTWVPHSWWWAPLWCLWTLFWILTRVFLGLKPSWGFGGLIVSIFVPNLLSIWTDSWLKGRHTRQSNAVDNIALVNVSFKLGYSNWT